MPEVFLSALKFTPKWVLAGMHDCCNFAFHTNRRPYHNQIMFFILSCTKTGACLCSFFFLPGCKFHMQ
jgi:hypothetical protein